MRLDGPGDVPFGTLSITVGKHKILTFPTFYFVFFLYLLHPVFFDAIVTIGAVTSSYRGVFFINPFWAD
jgi:hypothetical protein